MTHASAMTLPVMCKHKLNTNQINLIYAREPSL